MAFDEAWTDGWTLVAHQNGASRPTVVYQEDESVDFYEHNYPARYWVRECEDDPEILEVRTPGVLYSEMGYYDIRNSVTAGRWPKTGVFDNYVPE